MERLPEPDSDMERGSSLYDSGKLVRLYSNLLLDVLSLWTSLWQFVYQDYQRYVDVDSVSMNAGRPITWNVWTVD